MSVDKTKQACIRCVVQLSLAWLDWRNASGVNVHLQGLPVFVRTCVLGQLQHSRLHTPTFPLVLDQNLTFDRILTNCRSPSLFKEVIRGEHVKIEVIQVAPDYQSGKVLARFDSPAHAFLFPDVGPEDNDLRRLKFEHSRKYYNPPDLWYSCSTVLLEATVQSPVRLLIPRSSSVDELCTSDEEDSAELRESYLDEGQHRSSRPRKPDASRKLFSPSVCARDLSGVSQSLVSLSPSSTMQERLNLLLSKYEDPGKPGQREGGGEGREVVGVARWRDEDKDESRPRVSPCRVKFKPPVLCLRHVPEFSPPPPPLSTSRGIRTICYTSPGRRVGRHDWPQCPHRSPEHLQSKSAPNSSDTSPFSSRRPRSPYHQKCVTLPDEVLPDGFTPLIKSNPPELRPPFVVRHVDDSLLQERNFCRIYSNAHSPTRITASITKHPKSPSWSEDGVRLERRHSSDINPLPDEKQRYSSPNRSPYPDQRGTVLPSVVYSDQKSLPHSGQERLSHSPIISFSPRPPEKFPFYQSHVDKEDDLVSKYLTNTSGNRRPSPTGPHGYRACSADAIGDKLERLRQECCECLHSADSLGDDDLSEDVERLRASLQGERDDVLDRSSRFIPDQSVTVKLGPRDYWSKRMAEFTGKRHRVLFDETLEKIYNRLYTQASMAP